jgi:hypothetical protein
MENSNTIVGKKIVLPAKPNAGFVHNKKKKKNLCPPEINHNSDNQRHPKSVKNVTDLVIVRQPFEKRFFDFRTFLFALHYR